jgi:hypothetical protein
MLEKRAERLFVKVCEYFVYEGFRVYANDTHRWCDTDGFYEVEFSLQNGNQYLYIHTECGNQSLEDKWSKNNGVCYIADVVEYMSNDVYRYQMFFEDMVKSRLGDQLSDRMKKEIYQMIEDINNR